METTVQFIHLLAAIILAGSAFFVALVLVPVAKSRMTTEERIKFLSAAGRRAKWFGWAALAALGGTGLYRIWDLFGTPLWGTSYGKILIHKIFLVLLYVILAILHDFVLGPRKPRPLTRFLVRAQVLVLLVIVFLAAQLRMFSW